MIARRDTNFSAKVSPAFFVFLRISPYFVSFLRLNTAIATVEKGKVRSDER